MMAIIHSLKSIVPFSLAVPMLSLAVPVLSLIHCHSLPLFFTHCQSMSFVATRCTTRCHSLSLVVPLVVTCCHSLYHSLSLDVPLVCLFIYDLNINLFKQININQMFDKIQVMLMMKMSISNNRISWLKNSKCSQWIIRSSHRRSSIKKLLFKIYQYSLENACVLSLLIKLMAFRSATLFKRDSNTGVFLWILRNC